MLLCAGVFPSGCKDHEGQSGDGDVGEDMTQEGFDVETEDGIDDVPAEEEVVVESRLIGMWHLDDGAGTTAEDSSGKGNHGTLENMDPAASWTEGRFAGALRFDGTDDFVDCGDDESLAATEEVTIEAWVNAEDLPGVGVIAARGEFTYVLALDDANLAMLKIGDNTAWHTEVRGITPVTGGWFHVAGTYMRSTGEARIYVNGFEDGSTTGSGAAIGDRAASLSLGSASSYASRDFFSGLLDEVRLYDRALTAAEILERFGFIDYGVASRVAESRGVVTVESSDGRNLVIAQALDVGPTAYVLVTDIDTEETRQIWCPADVPQSAPYASMVASSGLFYTAQGNVFLEFDPAAEAFTFQGIPSPDGDAYLSFTEGLDGIIWAGAIYQTNLVSFDPGTRELTDHGRLDPVEQYLMHLALDDEGWVYGGIGTARMNIMAYNPATGEKLQLLDEAERVVGTAEVYPAADGSAVGIAGSQVYLLSGGTSTPIDASAAPPRRSVYNIYWGQTTGTFPDGRLLTGYSLQDRRMDIEDPSTGAVRRIAFDYETEGVSVTSLGEGPGGIVYGSTAHPMRFLALDTNVKSLSDYGHIPQIGGGNFCAIASQGDIVVGAQYSDGRLWGYDVTKPWNPTDRNPSLEITDGITVEAWVNPGALSDYGIIAVRGSYTYFFALNGANQVALLIGDNNDWNALAVGSTTVQGSWTHVAGTYDGATGTARVYVDGVEDGSDTGSAIPIGDRDAPLGIGAATYSDPGTYAFSGAIDELRIYASVLSPDEIARHAAQEYTDDGLRGLWHLDETAGAVTASDASGNENHLRLDGMDPSTCWTAGRIGGALSFDGADDHADIQSRGNPVILAQWQDEICRPRTALAHPDGNHVMMAGFADYGLVGGGIGIYNLATGEATLLPNEDLLPGLSPITLKAFADGNLVGGTSIEAPGGGHPTADEAELFLLDWATKQVTFHAVPVPGDGNIVSVQVGPDGLVYGLSGNATFFVFDPSSRLVVHIESYGEFGSVPRHALQLGPDGFLYAMLSGAILRITYGTFEHENIVDTPSPIAAGGALASGLLCYACGSHVWTYRLGP
jgi:hypothetical protein